MHTGQRKERKEEGRKPIEHNGVNDNAQPKGSVHPS